MANHFCSADLLIPENDFDTWAVIACDQHTSDISYWQNVRRIVGSKPSTLHMIIPEAELHSSDEKTAKTVCANMEDYLSSDLLKTYKDSYVYLERTLADGSVRQGIVGVVDLDTYDYDPKPDTRIFATEQTVLQRVPPRVAVRKLAQMELSHVVMFCDDNELRLIEPVGNKKDTLTKLYDFDLMADGGHLTGWLVQGEVAHAFSEAVEKYEAEKAYLVGDGNHSLVTAKLCYEAFKECHPTSEWANTPARYAMVELENIHSSAMKFEPIYRLVTCDYPEKLIADLQQLEVDSGAEVTWITENGEGTVHIAVPEGDLPIESLQMFLDQWVQDNNAQIDYIHGEDTTRELAAKAGNVGLLVPELGKEILFPYVLSGRVMPRKTFSIGHACEKRYYLEGRKIK